MLATKIDGVCAMDIQTWRYKNYILSLFNVHYNKIGTL